MANPPNPSLTRLPDGARVNQRMTASTIYLNSQRPNVLQERNSPCRLLMPQCTACIAVFRWGMAWAHVGQPRACSSHVCPADVMNEEQCRIQGLGIASGGGTCLAIRPRSGPGRPTTSRRTWTRKAHSKGNNIEL